MKGQTLTTAQLIAAIKANIDKYEDMIEAGAPDADRLQRVVASYRNDLKELEGCFSKLVRI